MIGIIKRARRISEEMLNDLVLYDIDTVTINEKLMVVDMGIEAQGSWLAGEKLVEIFSGGFGETVLSHMMVDDINLPCVDIFLDRPILNINIENILRVSENEINGTFLFEEDQDQCGMLYLEGENLSRKAVVEYAHRLIDEYHLRDLVVYASQFNSLVSAIFNATLGPKLLVESLLEYGFSKDQIFWSWCTCPILPMADIDAIANRRRQLALSAGSYNSIWLRAEDKDIENYMKIPMSIACVNIHNLKSAKTFTKGRVDYEAIIKEIFA